MAADIPAWLGTITVSLGGAGALGQAVRAIYRDWRADAAAREAALHTAQEARISAEREARVAAERYSAEARTAAERYAADLRTILTDINNHQRADTATLTRAADTLDGLTVILERLAASVPPMEGDPMRAPTPAPTPPRSSRRSTIP